MSFGLSPSDLWNVVQLTTQTYRSWKSACGEYAEITRQLSSLNQILIRVEQELHAPSSVFSNENEDFRPLARVLANCGAVVTELNTIIIKFKSLGSSRRKNWDRLRLSHQNLNDLRDRLILHTSTLSNYLDVVTLGAIGRIEQKMEDLAEMRLVMDDLAMQIRARSQSGSVMTSYDDDEKEVWRQFRRELIGEGFNSHAIQRHKADLKNYLKILQEEGVLDGSEYSVSTVTSASLEAKDFQFEIQHPDSTGDKRNDPASKSFKSKTTYFSEDEFNSSEDQSSGTELDYPSQARRRAPVVVGTASTMSFADRKKRYEPQNPESAAKEEKQPYQNEIPKTIKTSIVVPENNESADSIRGRQLRAALQEKLGGFSSEGDSPRPPPLSKRTPHQTQKTCLGSTKSNRDQPIDRQRKSRSLSPPPVRDDDDSGPLLLEWHGFPQQSFPQQSFPQQGPKPKEFAYARPPRPPPSTNKRRVPRSRPTHGQSSTSKATTSENLLLTVGALLLVGGGLASQRSRRRAASPRYRPSYSSDSEYDTEEDI